MPPSTEALGAVLRVVVSVVITAAVFIKIALVVIRSALLLPRGALVVVGSEAVGSLGMLVSVATAVAGGESKLLIVTARMLRGETSMAKVVVFVLVFRSVICEAEMAGVQVFEVIGAVAVLLVSVLEAFGVLSKVVGVKLINGAPCTDDRVGGVDCVSVIGVELERVVV